MASYTTTVGTLLEVGFDLGLKDYPIYDEKYRDTLNGKILEHYYFREIGLETPELFKRFLNRRMNEIMPLYNQLYLSEVDFDPFTNIDVTTTGERETKANEDRENTRTDSAETSTDNTTNSTARAVASNTPQMQLAGNEDYASAINDTTSESGAVGSSTASSNFEDLIKVNASNFEDYISRISGLQGITKSEALAQYRNTFLNIDLMIIDELSDLFIGIYNVSFGAFGIM